MPSTRHGTSTMAVTAPPDRDLSFVLPALGDAVLALPALGDAEVGLALVEAVTVGLEVVVGDAVVAVVVGGGGGVHGGPTMGLSNSVRSAGGETHAHIIASLTQHSAREHISGAQVVPV